MSQDNVRSYPHELRLSNESLTSIHGLELDGHRLLVIGATGGRSTVHAHSAVAIDDKLYLAVGNQVACLSMASPFELAWSTQVDTATCFGVYWAPERAALISHGELAITYYPAAGCQPLKCQYHSAAAALPPVVVGGMSVADMENRIEARIGKPAAHHALIVMFRAPL